MVLILVLVLSYWGLIVALPVLIEALPTSLNHPEVVRFFTVCFQRARSFCDLFSRRPLDFSSFILFYLDLGCVSTLLKVRFSYLKTCRECFCLLKRLTLTYESIRRKERFGSTKNTKVWRVKRFDNNKVNPRRAFIRWACEGWNISVPVRSLLDSLVLLKVLFWLDRYFLSLLFKHKAQCAVAVKYKYWT